MDDERRSMPHLTADANFTTMRLHDLLPMKKLDLAVLQKAYEGK